MKKIKLLLIVLTTAIALTAAYVLILKTKTKESPFIKYEKFIPNTFRVGFTNLDQEAIIPKLEIIGTIPKWLSGTLLRNGPAKFSEGKSFISNWFDGLAMIHAFSFHNGHVSYANKFLRTTDYNTVEQSGKMSYGGFAADPCKSIFKRLFSYFIKNDSKQLKMPNANVSIVKFTDHYTALTETPLPVEFDPQTLETLGVVHYNDSLPESNMHESAHPHYDFEHKEHISYCVEFGKVCYYKIYRIKDGQTKREVITSIDIHEPSYMHSFSITKNYAILVGIPLVVNPLDLLLKNQAFIKNFRWKPQLGTNFIVVDRINNKVIGCFRGDPFFMFHTVNAYEEDNKINLDIVTYKDSSTIGKATFNKILDPNYKSNNLAENPMSLKRFTIDLKGGTVLTKQLSDTLIELPRINYEKYNGKDYKFVYGESKIEGGIPYVATQLAKINVKSGKTIIWKEDNCYPSEPVFVESPNFRDEDDGIILSVVLDSKAETSFLLVLDAKTFKEIARAKVPHHIPYGIHGGYFKNNVNN